LKYWSFIPGATHARGARDPNPISRRKDGRNVSTGRRHDKIPQNIIVGRLFPIRPHVYYLLVYGTGHQKMMVGWSEKNKIEKNAKKSGEIRKGSVL
jgi:hypothetical protein